MRVGFTCRCCSPSLARAPWTPCLAPARAVAVATWARRSPATVWAAAQVLVHWPAAPPHPAPRHTASQCMLLPRYQKPQPDNCKQPQGRPKAEAALVL
jgi:hypothetical protein